MGEKRREEGREKEGILPRLASIRGREGHGVRCRGLGGGGVLRGLWLVRWENDMGFHSGLLPMCSFIRILKGDTHYWCFV